MPTPTVNQVHEDKLLTNVSIGYRPGGLIATDIFPAIAVQKVSDKYVTYDKADWLRREAALRAPGTRAARGGYRLSTALYTCTERAIAQAVPDEVVRNADSPLQPLRDATFWTTDQLLLEVESDVAGQVFGTGWSNSATPSPVWSNDASEPLDDIDTARNTIVSGIGREANYGTVGRGVWRHLRNHPDIVERVKGAAGPNSPAVVMVNAVAALAELDRLLVGVSVENTAVEGAAASMSYIWGSHFFVGYVTTRPSLLEPSAGYVFTFQQRQVSRFREDQERQDVVETRMSWDTVLTATDAGYLLKSVV